MRTATVACPSCRVSLQLASDAAGRKVRCSRCGNIFAPQMDTALPSAEQVLADLVSLWQRHHAEGRSSSPAELCRDHPELLPELERQIAVLRQMDKLAANGSQNHQLDTYATNPQDSTAGLDGCDTPPSASCLRPPQQADELGRLSSYRVLKVLGQGGMGRVYQAEDTLLQRLVALKILLPQHAGDAEARQRFLREARAAADQRQTDGRVLEGSGGEETMKSSSPVTRTSPAHPRLRLMEIERTFDNCNRRSQQPRRCVSNLNFSSTRR